MNKKTKIRLNKNNSEPKIQMNRKLIFDKWFIFEYLFILKMVQIIKKYSCLNMFIFKNYKHV